MRKPRGSCQGFRRNRSVAGTTNAERLAAECAVLAEQLLHSAPGLRLLVSSREILGVPGEAVWSVPPLSIPRPDAVVSPADAETVRRVQQAWAAALGKSAVELTAFQSGLRPGELVLEFVLDEPSSYCLAVRNTGVAVHSLDSRRKIEGAVDQMLRSIRSSSCVEDSFII